MYLCVRLKVCTTVRERRERGRGGGKNPFRVTKDVSATLPSDVKDLLSEKRDSIITDNQ
jgi:hypothetical protein